MGDKSAPSTTAALTFNLDDPEGERRLRECLDAPKWKCAVWEYERFLRGVIDATDESLADLMCFESARDKLFDIFGEHSIDIWEE